MEETKTTYFVSLLLRMNLMVLKVKSNQKKQKKKKDFSINHFRLQFQLT